MDCFRGEAESGQAGGDMRRPAHQPHDAADACAVRVLSLHQPPQRRRSASARRAGQP